MDLGYRWNEDGHHGRVVKALACSVDWALPTWVQIPLMSNIFCHIYYDCDHALVAQWIEHQTSNLGVAGSSPASCIRILFSYIAISCRYGQVARQPLRKR
jgi:hypothetical protein